MRLKRVVMEYAGRPVSRAGAVDGWQHDPGFREVFNTLLAAAPFAAFRWETPPMTADTMDEPFEFVLLDAPELERAAEPEVFAEHFRTATEQEAVRFTNLGGDATLVVPVPPAGKPAAWTHLGAFVRQAPPARWHAFWQATGAAVQARLGPRPLWLSTAGDGVAWLHVRLDDRPKYYHYAPWRQV